MASIFLGVPIVFNVSSFQFHQVKSPTSSPIMSGPQFIRSQFTGLSGLGEMLESYNELQPKLKQLSSLQMHFSWFGLRCRRKPLTTLWKTTAIDFGHVYQPSVQILNM